MTAHTAGLIMDMMAGLKQDMLAAQMPVCLINVSNEDRVDNTASVELFKFAKNVQNEAHLIEGADHANIVFDELHCRSLILKSVRFCDKLL